MLAYVHARREPPDDHAGGEGSSSAGNANDPIGIILAVWLWSVMLVMLAGFVFPWL